MAESTNKPHDHGHEHEVNPGVSHERRDVNVFQISAFGIGLLLSCIVVVFAMWALFDFLFSREEAKNVGANPAALMMKQRATIPPGAAAAGRTESGTERFEGGRGCDPEQLRLDQSGQGHCTDSDRRGDQYSGSEGPAFQTKSRRAGQRRVPDNSGRFQQR